jgi:hypothetical protein
MKVMLILMLTFCALAVKAQNFYGLDIKQPADYERECAYWGNKAEPDKRGSTCIAFIQGMKAAMLARRVNQRCKQEIQAISPMLIHDALIALKNEPISIADASEEMLEVFAKSCFSKR